MSQLLEQLPKGPHLIQHFKPVQSGVDFLNLRQVNFDYMGECIPGINNVTLYLRPYSVVCWIYWQLQQQLESGALKEIHSSEVKAFREKVESLQLWGHRLHDCRGLPGMGTDMPPVENGMRSLLFIDWGNRQARNTGLQAPVQYGPSLSDISGLGFLHYEEGEIYRVTARGAQLAEALDAQLKQAGEAYDRLCKINELSAHEDDARALYPYWKVDESSDAEAEVFQQALFQSDQIDNMNSGLGKRSASIQIILSILEKAEKPLELQEIRDRMAFPRSWGENPEEWSEGMNRQSRIWLLLQFRQLHRLALEALMGWLQFQLNHDRTMREPDAIVDRVQGLFIGESGLSKTATVKELVDGVPTGHVGIEEYLAKRESDPAQFDPHEICEQILSLSKKNAPELATECIKALLLLYQCREWFRADQVIKKYLSHGGATRVSLEHCFVTIERLHSQPNRALFDWVMKSLIICQHFATGTERFDGERIRLRFVLDEEGLEPIGDHVWHPIVTADRLASLLSLMHCSGMLKQQDGQFSLRDNK